MWTKSFHCDIEARGLDIKGVKLAREPRSFSLISFIHLTFLVKTFPVKVFCLMWSAMSMNYHCFWNILGDFYSSWQRPVCQTILQAEVVNYDVAPCGVPEESQWWFALPANLASKFPSPKNPSTSCYPSKIDSNPPHKTPKRQRTQKPSETQTK